MELVPLAVFAVRVRDLRRKAGMSQEALSARAQISLRTVARLESADNQQLPTRATVALLAAALGVHPDALLYTNGDEETAA